MKLVIFDMDGVLIDSQPIYAGVIRELCAELGIVVSPADYDLFAGMPSLQQWIYLQRQYGFDRTPGELSAVERERQYARILQSEHLKPIPGVIELLETLRRHEISLCIASSSSSRAIRMIIAKLNIDRYFSEIISGDEVERGKPAPDIFQKAAERFGINPLHCAVIEDSGNGVRAAKAAGMFCVGFQNPNSGRQDLSGADLVIDSFGPSNIEILMTRFGITASRDDVQV